MVIGERRFGIMNKTSLSQRIFDIFNVLFMLFMIAVCIYPMLYVLFASLSDANELMAHSGLLFKPLGANLEAYKAVFKNPMILKGYMNTIYIIVFGVSLNVLLTGLGAYFMSQKNVYFQKHITLYILFTMFFNGGLIPFYLTVKTLGMYNTRLALIIPTAINTFNMIIMRTSFQTIPESLKEAAKIDGASHMMIFTKIVLPLSKTIIAVMVLYYGVEHWNAWFNAMIFLNNRDLFPLQLILREILLVNDTSNMVVGQTFADGIFLSETIKYAVVIVATVPILAVYPFLQKYFITGVMLGAVKE